MQGFGRMIPREPRLRTPHNMMVGWQIPVHDKQPTYPHLGGEDEATSIQALRRASCDAVEVCFRPRFLFFPTNATPRPKTTAGNSAFRDFRGNAVDRTTRSACQLVHQVQTIFLLAPCRSAFPFWPAKYESGGMKAMTKGNGSKARS